MSLEDIIFVFLLGKVLYALFVVLLVARWLRLHNGPMSPTLTPQVYTGGKTVFYSEQWPVLCTQPFYYQLYPGPFW